MRPRWRKLLRDLSVERGRVALMVVAIAVSLSGVGAVLGSYSIMMREMPRNYLGTHPPSATLVLSDGVPPTLVEQARRHPGIAEAEAGDVVLTRVRVGDDWVPLLLFVTDGSPSPRLNRVTVERGAWPPPEGTMLIERSAQRLLHATDGDTMLVKAPHGRTSPVLVSGVVHDPALAPAWQERQGYGYVTRATLARLGEPPVLDELRILVGDGPQRLSTIEATVNEFGRTLAAGGRTVMEARVPPPGRHPHQSQMMGVMFLMIAFSGMSLVLSAILVATSLAAILGRQVREIGVMKAVGARRGQLAALFGVFVLAMGALAVGLAIPLGAYGARILAGVVAHLLNLDLASDAIAWWVFAIQIAGGLLVPLAFAAIPIARAAGMSVREAMDQYGVARLEKGAAGRAVGAALAWLGRRNRGLVLMVRNSFRRRVRLLLTVTLLSAGGAMFMTSLNLSRGWGRIVERVYQDRAYDVEVRLDAPASITAELAKLPGVRHVEAWGFRRAAVWKEGSVDVVRTYPDGGHGSLSMMAPPLGTSLVHFPLLAGRWLQAGDTDAVVLNHMALAQLPGATLGSGVVLSLNGRPTRWKVVGLVEEIGSAGVAYVTPAGWAGAVGSEERVKMLRLSTAATSAGERAALIRFVEQRLDAANAGVERVIPLAMLRTAMGDHVLVLTRILLAMAALMVIVGLLGLTSAMGTSVVERTREIGVMKTVGATAGQVARLIGGEGIFIGATSWAVSIALSLPLTLLVGRTVGMLAFRVRLPLVVDVAGVAGWLALALPFAALATALPARAAARLTVGAALGRV